MGKRGPAAKGEYPDKTQVLSTRISAELREALEIAAKGSTLSREIEHRLRRTFDQDKEINLVFSSRRMFQLMRLIASVIDSTVSRKVAAPKKPNLDWLNDPYAYDQAMRAVVDLFERMRPPGVIPQSLDEALDQYDGTFEGKFNAIETLRDIQRSPDGLLVKGSRHQKTMAGMKKDIGDLADRALIYGRSGDETRKLSELGRKLAALRRKRAKTPEAMTATDYEQMKAIASEIEQLQQGGDQ